SQIKSLASCTRVYRPRDQSRLYVSCTSSEEAAKLVASVNDSRLTQDGTAISAHAEIDDYVPRKLEKRPSTAPIPHIPDLSRIVSNSSCGVVNIHLNFSQFTPKRWKGASGGASQEGRGGQV
ncbi:hypothetical protein PFISCL1PPCAC_7858, partial [Pristionchus fissidentatus]